MDTNPQKDEARAAFSTGCEYHERGMLSEAIVEFNAVIGIKPTHFFAHHNKGICLFKLKKYDEAIISFSRAAEIRPYNSEPFRLIAECHFKKREFAKAVPNYKKALCINYDYGNLHFKLGLALYFTSDYNGALKSFTRAQSCTRTTIKIETLDYWCARCFEKMHLPMEESCALRNALNANPGEKLKRKITRMLSEIGEWDGKSFKKPVKPQSPASNYQIISEKRLVLIRLPRP
ncbi:MAG: tetratricopeptide repeat protein [Candidatus Micrarchaeia archaeon]